MKQQEEKLIKKDYEYKDLHKYVDFVGATNFYSSFYSSLASYQKMWYVSFSSKPAPFLNQVLTLINSN